MTPLQRGLLRLLRVPRTGTPPDLARARVLAVQVAGMGDFLLAVPALRAIKRTFPQARLELLTSAKGRRAAEGCPYLDAVHAVDARVLLNHGGGWRGLAGLVRALRRARYDLAVNLIGLYSPGGAVRMGLFLRALGARALAGRDTLGTGTFFHHAVDETLEAPCNERDANLALAARLGASDPEAGVLETWPAPGDERDAEALAAGLPGRGPLVGVNPGSDRPEKVWPEERFLEVLRGLRTEREARFLLTGGPAEAALTARMCRVLGPCAADTTGRIGFHGTAALMRRMDLFLTCDTAAVHLAWAAKVPTVALFKRENLGRYRPGTERVRCLVGRETDPRGSIELDAGEVLRACAARLEAAGGRPAGEARERS